MSVLDFLKNVLGLRDESLLKEALCLCDVRHMKKGETLIAPGEIPDHLYLLMDGIFRGFFPDVDGKDITDCLVAHPGFSLMHSSDLTEESRITVEALTDATVFSLPMSEFYAMVDKFPSVYTLYKKMVLFSVDYHRQIKIMMYQYSAAQRYHWFIKHYPGILNRISHKYIASFLNMTPVTLSRLLNTPVPSEETENLYELFSFPQLSATSD